MMTLSSGVEIMDLEVWAIRCLYVMGGRASVVFPNSTRSGPSPNVWVGLNSLGAYRGGDVGYFPFEVDWKTWHETLRPVCLDPDLSLAVTANRAYLEKGQLDGLILKIQAALATRMGLDVDGNCIP